MTAPIQHPISGEGVANAVVFAQAPDYAGLPSYLTAGKRYEALGSDNIGFDLIDDNGDRIYCLWEECAFLDGGNWTRSAATAARQQGEGK